MTGINCTYKYISVDAKITVRGVSQPSGMGEPDEPKTVLPGVKTTIPYSGFTLGCTFLLLITCWYLPGMRALNLTYVEGFIEEGDFHLKSSRNIYIQKNVEFNSRYENFLTFELNSVYLTNFNIKPQSDLDSYRMWNMGSPDYTFQWSPCSKEPWKCDRVSTYYQSCSSSELAFFMENDETFSVTTKPPNGDRNECRAVRGLLRANYYMVLVTIGATIAFIVFDLKFNKEFVIATVILYSLLLIFTIAILTSGAYNASFIFKEWVGAAAYTGSHAYNSTTAKTLDHFTGADTHALLFFHFLFILVGLVGSGFTLAASLRGETELRENMNPLL